MKGEQSDSAAAMQEMFGDSMMKGGSRLGISYIRAQVPRLDILVGPSGSGQVLTLSQDVADEEAISGVVWDAGLLVIDYMISREAERRRRKEVERGEETKYILDLGCGTGVVGLAAHSITHSSSTPTVVFFSDMPSTSHLLQQNLPPVHVSVSEHMPSSLPLSAKVLQLQTQVLQDAQAATGEGADGVGDGEAKRAAACRESDESVFIPYQWSSPLPPPRKLVCPLGQAHLWWDTVYCSDVLYDEKAHTPLLALLRQLQLNPDQTKSETKTETQVCGKGKGKIVFGYKQRHHIAEKSFFEQLSQWCSLRVVGIAETGTACAVAVGGYAETETDTHTHASRIRLVNCSPTMIGGGSGLFLVEATPR